MIDIMEDVSAITTIPKDSLNKIVEKQTWCICHALQESKLNYENIVEINIGIGSLLISDQDEVVKYKFIPSETLEEAINETLKSGKSPLELKLEKSLINKIVKTYKDII